MKLKLVKLQHVILMLYVLSLLFIMAACKKSDQAASASGTQLSFALSASNSSSAVVASFGNGAQAVNSLATNGTTSASINWTAATANVSAFKFEAKKAGAEVEITSHNLTSVNLFATTPVSVSTAIDAGTYSEIEIKVLLVKSNTSIPLVLKGNYTSTNGTVTPIEFDLNEDAIIKLEAENVTVDDKTDLAAVAKLNLNKLISGAAAATLDAATRTNGTIVISSSVNTNIYNLIKLNVAQSGSWGGFEHHDKSERKQ